MIHPLPPLYFSIFLEDTERRGGMGWLKGQQVNARESGVQSSVGPSGRWATLNESLHSLGFAFLIHIRKDLE